MTSEPIRSDANGAIPARLTMSGESAVRHLAAAPTLGREHAFLPKSYEPNLFSPIRTESAFRSIDARCRATGGLACGDALSRLLGSQCGGNFVTLARMVSADKVFGFPWRDVFWVPVFQFDLSDLSLKRTPQEVRTELGRNFDGWELATWFTSPNVWLQDRPPVDLLDWDSLSVLKAARADRFVVEG